MDKERKMDLVIAISFFVSFVLLLFSICLQLFSTKLKKEQLAFLEAKHYVTTKEEAFTEPSETILHAQTPEIEEESSLTEEMATAIPAIQPFEETKAKDSNVESNRERETSAQKTSHTKNKKPVKHNPKEDVSTPTASNKTSSKKEESSTALPSKPSQNQIETPCTSKPNKTDTQTTKKETKPVTEAITESELVPVLSVNLKTKTIHGPNCPILSKTNPEDIKEIRRNEVDEYLLEGYKICKKCKGYA